MASPEFKEVVIRLRDRGPPAAEEVDEQIAMVGLELGALYVGTLQYFWNFLHPDGRLFVYDTMFDESEGFADDLASVYGLRLGSRLYPELAALLTPQPADMVACTACLGIGWAGPSSDPYPCLTCRGRGW